MKSADDGGDVCAEREDAEEREGADITAILYFLSQAEEDEIQHFGRLLKVVLIGTICSDGRAFIVAKVVPGFSMYESRVPGSTCWAYMFEGWRVGLEKLDVVHFHVEGPCIVA